MTVMLNAFKSIFQRGGTSVALSIGSNRADRRWYIEQMETLLRGIIGPEMRSSSLMETEPLEVDPGQPWYLNKIVGGHYTGEPMELLDSCQSIELRLGRTGKGSRMPRTADVDILLFGSVALSDETLTIPHPGVLSRRFCLEGLMQIMPDALLPHSGKTVRDHYSCMGSSLAGQSIRYVVPQGESDEK